MPMINLRLVLSSIKSGALRAIAWMREPEDAAYLRVLRGGWDRAVSKGYIVITWDEHRRSKHPDQFIRDDDGA